jgi:hypothetical protein
MNMPVGLYRPKKPIFITVIFQIVLVLTDMGRDSSHICKETFIRRCERVEVADILEAN